MKVRYDPITGQEIREFAFDPPIVGADEDDEEAMARILTILVRDDDDEIGVRWTVDTIRQRLQVLFAALNLARHARDNAADDCCEERQALNRGMDEVWGLMERWEVALWDH